MVDARIVEHFDQRGGYRQSHEVVDAPRIEALFEHDLAAVQLAAAQAN